MPVGYLNTREPDSKKATVILDEQRAFLVKRKFQEYATGTVSMAELAKIAGNWSLMSPRTGKPFTKAAIANILKNPFYCGKMVVREKLYPHAYPKLIDQKLFEQCQTVMDAARTQQQPEQRKQQRAKKGKLRNVDTSGFQSRQPFQKFESGAETKDLEFGVFELVAREGKRPL